VKSFPNPNLIQYNFNQGILVTEGSSAQILANKLDGNIKANIACGGECSGKIRIMYNYIENSKQEGIYVVDGERELVIEDNMIESNNDGVVLVNSEGQLKDN
jgi:parallel beta-helix repeat protein